MVHKGRVVTISDLKEVLKAKTEGTDRQQRGEERSYHGGELLLLGASCQTTVNTNTKSFKKKLYLRLNFILRFT